MRKNSLIIVFFLFLLLGCTSEMDKRVGNCPFNFRVK